MGNWEVMYIHNSRKYRERNVERLLREVKMPHTRTWRVRKTTIKSVSNKRQKKEMKTTLELESEAKCVHLSVSIEDFLCTSVWVWLLELESALEWKFECMIVGVGDCIWEWMLKLEYAYVWHVLNSLYKCDILLIALSLVYWWSLN